MKREKRKVSASVKTVELATVKLGRSIASHTGTAKSQRAEFARKFIEESRLRSRALYEANAVS